jgi:hypothetical protein
VSGIAASSLVVLAPVKPGSEQRLLAALAALGDGEQGPFAAAPGTHFGRFAFVPALQDQDGRPLASQGSFLLMCADFDTTVWEWSGELCARAGAQLDSVMGHCEGFPGSDDPAAVADYLTRHDARPGFTVPGYRPVTVGEVREKLRLARALRELAARAQADGLEGEALRRAWREATGRSCSRTFRAT